MAMPPAVFRPRSATAIAENPMPDRKPMLYECVSPKTAGRPDKPAIAPEITRAIRIIRFELTPLTRAAIGLAPDARSSKPNRVRFTTNQKVNPSAIAIISIPLTCPPGISGTPSLVRSGTRSGNQALVGSSLVERLLEPSVMTAKCCENKYEVNPTAKLFNIMVEMTSFTPRLTLR